MHRTLQIEMANQGWETPRVERAHSLKHRPRARCRASRFKELEGENKVEQNGSRRESNGAASTSGAAPRSISSIPTREWEQKYAADGCVDLWVEEEFNAGSRLSGGRDAYRGRQPGTGSGEGPSLGNAPRHKIKIMNHHTSQELEVEVPEDRYILAEAEEQGLLLPWACRMGCCTTCAVRVLEGEVYQPQSLGVSRELRDAGYALMCVSYPKTDAVLETVEEDEVYDLQFGKAFAERALKPSDRDSIERDDFAFEIANMDE